MIFITTGSRSFQFNRLLKAVDEAIEIGKITEDVFAQIGNSDYKIKHYQFVEFLNHDEFNEKLQQSDIVITHGGTGVIVNSAKMGKRVVAVPRLKEYGEVVDNHQIQLIKAFDALGIITPCWECNPMSISQAIINAKKKETIVYHSNSQNIIDSIEDMIQKESTHRGVKKTVDSNQPIRVLMCSSARTEKGGMNSVIDQLMDHDWGKDIELSYLATHITGNPVKKILFFTKAFIKLKRLLKNNAFDLIHIHMSYRGSFYRKYIVTKECKKYNKKVIIHLHGSEFKEFYKNGTNNLKRKIKELFTIADCTFVLGKDWKNFIKRIAPKSHILVINNAISMPEITEKEEDKIPHILFLGALIKRKGVIDLLNAARTIQKSVQNPFILNIAGSGEEENALKKYVEINRMKEYVNFLGWIDNEEKKKLLASSDILVLPSYNEGLPIAILEALSYGLPVVSTNVGSISEAIENNKNGFLYNPGDVETLCKLMKKLIENREMWKKFSKSAQEIVRSRFSEDVFFSKIEKIYKLLA